MVKNLPVNAGRQVQSLVWKASGLGRPPEERNGDHSSILAWEIPWTEEAGRLSSPGVRKSQT